MIGDSTSSIGIGRFESLGDNCEFGFVQRVLGNDTSSLFRWAIAAPAPLLRAFADDFAGLYQYENLEPSAVDMVRDNRYGFFFHTAMRSVDKVFVQPDSERRITYQSEKAKMDHLMARFRTRLADPSTIFVYKTNPGVTDQDASMLLHAIRKYGDANLLVVRVAGAEAAPGTVRRAADGLLIGYVDRFAAYTKADDVSADIWNDVVRNTLLLIDPVLDIRVLQQYFNSFSELNYSIHIDPDLRFIYFNNPKAACTTIKASLNLSYAHYSGQHLSYDSIGDIHNRSKNLLLTPDEVGTNTLLQLLADDRVFKFCFVREPLARLCSAYESKVRWASPPLQNLAQVTGHDTDWRPTFEEFAAELAGSATARDCDEHWRLQARQICLDHVRYNFIGDFDRVEEDLTQVLTKLFGNSARLYDVRQYFEGNTSGSAPRLAAVQPAVRDAVLAAYAADVTLHRRALAGRSLA